MKSSSVFAFAIVFCLCIGIQVTSAQEPVAAPRKFDEFWYLRTSDVRARLDLFAKALSGENLRGSLVGYRTDGKLPGSFLRELHGYRHYLVNSRGIDPSRIDLIDGGVRDPPMIELWLAPRSAPLPHTSKDTPVESNLPVQFDALGIGSGCVGQYTLVLEDPDDALRIFAQALKSNPTAKGFVLIHPSTLGRLRGARKLAASSKATLVKLGVNANRIGISVEGRRPCSEMALWLAPPNVVIPGNTNVGLFFQSQLMAEAERNRYIIRRIEFIGNEQTPDLTLRRRTLDLKEGEVFKKAMLQQSLASLSRVKSLRSVGLTDVDIHLNSREKEINISILVSERQR